MEEKYSGIVLNSVSYGENDKILTIFTLEKGILSAKIKGVKKAGAKMKFASEPFCFAEFVFASKNGLRTVIGASLTDSFYPVREDIRKFFAAGAVAEFVKKFIREGIVSEKLFMLVINALKSLAYGEVRFDVVLASFLTEGLREAGYGLNSDGCFNCGCDICGRTFFDYSVGGFLCEDCFNGTGREVNNSTYRSLAAISAGKEVPDATKCLKLLNFYITTKAEESIKSLQELIKLADLTE